MTFENERSNRNRERRFESISSSICQLQSKRLNESIIYNRIWNQLDQKQFHEHQIIFNYKKLSFQIKFEIFRINEKKFYSKKNEKRKQVYKKIKKNQNVFSKKIQMNSNSNEKINESKKNIQRQNFV